MKAIKAQTFMFAQNSSKSAFIRDFVIKTLKSDDIQYHKTKEVAERLSLLYHIF